MSAPGAVFAYTAAKQALADAIAAGGSAVAGDGSDGAPVALPQLMEGSANDIRNREKLSLVQLNDGSYTAIPRLEA